MEPDNDTTESYITLAKDTLVGHYRIIEKIGAGGMGVVYLAEDTKLHRCAALKFLPNHLVANTDAKARFIREAEAAAKLNHPNIVTIYEVGEFNGRPFFAMEHVGGKSLSEMIKSEELGLDTIAELAVQICEGLGKAHRAGVIHRDVKPSNIMIDADGRPKLLDFGLAALPYTEKLTPTGSTLGTMGYMSPEQIQVKQIDQRSDLFSFGVLLYELITGRMPFKGDNEASTLNSILNDIPEPLSRYKSGVSAQLQQIITKLLEKDPQLRYQSAAGVVSDLKRLDVAGKTAAPTGRSRTRTVVLLTAAVVVLLAIIGITILPDYLRKEEIPSIAVLPFADLSAGQDQAYFCEGMAEDLISALTKLENLRVLARTSSFAFKGQDKTQIDIGRKLKVQTLLTGSVRQADNRLRVTAQLINVDDGYHLWSERYDRELSDVFAIQDEISQAIVAALEVQLTDQGQPTLVGHRTDNLQAYDLFLQGRYYLGQRTFAGFQKALQKFREAIAEDPTFALAHVGVADCYNLIGFYDILPASETFPLARAAALRALEIDQTLGEAYTSLAHATEFYDWDWPAAESLYVQALKLNPGHAFTHQCYAEFLSAMGRHQEAATAYEQARLLDPLSPAIGSNIAGSFFMARDYDRALAEYQKTLELDPNFVATHFFLGYVKAYLGNYPEAMAEIQKAVSLAGDTTSALAAVMGYIHALAGREDMATAILKQLNKTAATAHISPYGMALIHIALNQKDQAFTWLDKAYQMRDPWLVFLKVNPMLDSLRSDARFNELLQKMNLDRQAHTDA